MKRNNSRDCRPRQSVRKILSLVLSLCLMISITAGIDFSANAQYYTIEQVAQMSGFQPGTQRSDLNCKTFCNAVWSKMYGLTLGSQKSNQIELNTGSGNYQIGSTLSYSSGNLNSNNVQNLLRQSISGDVIQLYSNSTGFLHAAMIYSNNGTGITIYDCIRINGVYTVRTKSYSTYAAFDSGWFKHSSGEGISLYRSPNNTGSPSGGSGDLSNDKTPPTITDFRIGDITSSQFTIIAHVQDASNISSVKYAVWTDKNGQDDLKWYNAVCNESNGYYWYCVNFSNHNNEKGTYLIHMYAYDTAGNEAFNGIGYNFSIKSPGISDFHVDNLNENGFKLTSKIDNRNGISRVAYAVWTEKNGQDDLKWYEAKGDDKGYYSCTVNFNEHNNEKGKYIIHLYAYDSAQEHNSAEIIYEFPNEGPTISNVKISNVTSNGYTVTCTVESKIGVSNVFFPTWTNKNGQDDLATEWWSNSKVIGSKNGNTVTFNVKSNEHNNETGIYNTHIYAYDQIGNYTFYGFSVNVHDHKSISSNNAIKATCTTTGKESDTKCSVCGIKLTTGKTISATGHKSVLSNNAIAPTCTIDGKESDTKCSTCGVKLTTGKTITAKGHSYTKTKVVAPTYAAKGYTLYTCSTCKATKKSDYKNALTVAKSTVTKLASPKSKQIIVTWGKKSYTGYQVQIATDSKFTKNKKSATIKSAKTISKTFTGLKGKTKYYVRVRAYKTYNGKNYYSSWSTVKTITTKK